MIPGDTTTPGGILIFLVACFYADRTDTGYVDTLCNNMAKGVRKGVWVETPLELGILRKL